MTIPVWLTDLPGAFVALGVTSAGYCLGLRSWRQFLWPLGLCCGVGLSTSISFYVHTTRTVFNRRPPLSIWPFLQHLMMTRPLEILWRFLTVPLRVTPDVLLLGETRTGTTTLAAHMRSAGWIGPFSPWVVPLATDKESFYFVGHYWGILHPGAYRMCFPLKISQWLRRMVFGAAPPVFDACASHLNAPWAAELLHTAAPEAALLVLLRPPAEQNQSWWRLEMGAHAWAAAMGMGKDFLLPEYPPRSLSEAVDLSRSSRIQDLYKEGEELPKKVLSGFGGRGLLGAWLSPRAPERLLPFPGGQLAAMVHMGQYCENISRYLRFYSSARLVYGETSELSRPTGAEDILQRLCEQVQGLQPAREKVRLSQQTSTVLRLNEAPPLPAALEPSTAELAKLREMYIDANSRLFHLIGRDLGWNQ